MRLNPLVYNRQMSWIYTHRPHGKVIEQWERVKVKDKKQEDKNKPQELCSFARGTHV